MDGIPASSESGPVFVNTRPMHSPSRHFPRSFREWGAFTLVELLVVIGVIAILVAILLPVMGTVRGRMDSAQCLRQLSQVGTAMGAYITDHNDLLPGPLTVTQSPTYIVGQTGSLAALLDPYLGSPGPNLAPGTSRYVPVFECPAAGRLLNDPTKPTFLMNTVPAAESNQSILGDPSLNQQPLAKTAILNWSWYDDYGEPLTLPEMWIMQDADQNYVTSHQSGFVSVPNISSLLPTPAHVDHYNALFFDFHVAQRNPSLSLTAPSPSAGSSAPPSSGSGTTDSAQPPPSSGTGSSPPSSANP